MYMIIILIFCRHLYVNHAEMTEAEPDETFSQEVFDDSDIVVELKTTCAISDYQHYSYEFEPRAWLGVLDTTLCEIRFVSDLWQVDGFLRVLRFPPPIQQSTTI